VRVVRQGPGSPRRGQNLGVEALVGTLRQEQLRQSDLEPAEYGTGAAVVHDQVDQWQHCGLRHKPLDVNILRHVSQGGWVSFRPNRHQNIHIERRDLSDQRLNTSTAPNETVPSVR
jgi:hypothetical protein